MAKKSLLWVVVVLVVLFGLIQLIPYGRDHSNPPTTQEPQWDSPQTRALVATTCFNCHSSETKWPWYSNIAPASWLVMRDVQEGRSMLNFSEWDRPQPLAGEAAEVVLEGEMPPSYYLLLHPEARLTNEQRSSLANGLRASFAPQ